jgi:predicted Fe-S protein YdhL (DUF1289 family)
MVEDSPCTGDCRMVTVAGRARCRSCHRDYNDLEQWFYMTKEARLERMKQLENEKQNKK